MKKNLKKKLTFINGEPLTTQTMGEDGKKQSVPLLASDVISRAMFEVANAVPLSPEEKYKAFKICQRIMANPEAAELESDDIVLIRKIIGPSFSAGVYGQIVDLLEGN